MTRCLGAAIVKRMIGAHRIEGYAIISADGMIAGGDGTMPESIRNDADQRFFQAELDRAAVIVHGRHSHEGGPRAARRKRLILTRQIASIARDRSNPNARLWNPAGAPLKAAVATFGPLEGAVAVIGGTDVFGLFLPLYEAFHLTRVDHVQIPGGRPVFPGVDRHSTPEALLERQGLKRGRRREIDAAAGIALTTWER
jgi:dihydrofolate reductase